MHELSIVTYVIEQVEEIAKENHLTDIAIQCGKICLHCGSRAMK